MKWYFISKYTIISWCYSLTVITTHSQMVHPLYESYLQKMKRGLRAKNAIESQQSTGSLTDTNLLILSRSVFI